MSSLQNNRQDQSEPVQPSEAKNRVYVIDDDSDVRKSLYFLLSSSEIHSWPFASAADFLEQLPFLTPAPILLDIRMAQMDGLQLLTILKERAVAWPVIILTAHGDVGLAVRAMKLGAIEFLEKPYAPEAIQQAIAQAFAILEEKEHVLSARDRARYLLGKLTGREGEIIAILMEGVHNKQVAHRLGLSVRTVEMHRANALAKLEVRSIAEVVQLANLGGLTPEMKLHLNNHGRN